MLLLLSLSSLGAAVDPKTYIPTSAYQYFPVVQQTQQKYFPSITDLSYLPALIEQESCIHLKHSRCFNAKSSLKNHREEGAGFFQLTRAYNESGKVRFDTLSGLTSKYKRELSDLNWANVYDRPDLQIRAGVLLVKDIESGFRQIPEQTRLHFVDSAFNGGSRDVNKARTVCGLAANCDPNIWFNHTERYCVKSKKPIKMYGNKSPCDINTEHVRNVFKIRIDKYRPYFDKR